MILQEPPRILEYSLNVVLFSPPPIIEQLLDVWLFAPPRIPESVPDELLFVPPTIVSAHTVPVNSVVFGLNDTGNVFPKPSLIVCVVVPVNDSLLNNFNNELKVLFIKLLFQVF